MPPRSASPDRKQSSFRPEIQGLRAVAVVAVVLNHLTGWPGGGFVGVDIFFVISGFLITGLLLDERRRTGRISFVGFYRRRARRLLPAAGVVLVVTVLASFAVLNSGRGKQTLVDGLWSAFFSANWHFAWTGTDYFSAGGARSPFEHFWSLAVEEQFYVLWPCLIVALYALVGRRVAYATQIGHRLVGATMTLLVVLSFGYACLLTASNPTWAYFSTFARIWELGVGALLAVIAGSLSSIPAAWRPTLGWLGLAGIVVSFVVIGQDAPLLGSWGTLPVLATALVIAAGTGAPPRSLLPLTHPVSVWVGELSYSLYLWHFPVIVLLAAVLPDSSLLYYVCSGVLILGLSVASFYGVEDPLRRSSWLSGRPPASRRTPRPAIGRRLRPIGVGSLAVASLMFAGLAVAGQPSAGTAPAPVVSPPASSAAGVEVDPREERESAISAALAATRWPTLKPGLGHLAEAVDLPPCALSFRSRQLNGAGEVRRRCVHGDPAADRTVLLVGDSLANSYLPAVLAAVEPQGWNVVGLTRSGCPALRIEVLLIGTRLPYPQCTEQQELLAGWVDELDPDLIVVTSSPRTVRDLLASDATGTKALREWRDGATSSLETFADAAPVVVLQAPPRSRDLTQCATRFSEPADCVSTPSEEHVDFRKAEREAVKALEDPQVRYVSTQRWFCSREKQCPAFVGNTPTFADGGHLTVDAARALGPLVRRALQKPMADRS